MFTKFLDKLSALLRCCGRNLRNVKLVLRIRIRVFDVHCDANPFS